MSLKREKVCPQCHHRKVWHIAKVQDFEAKELPIAVDVRWSGAHHHGGFETFICAGCGWTEWYAIELNELREDPSNGVHLIDNEPKAGLR